MNRHWTWSLLVAALLALHAHGWLHADHGVSDELSSVSDTVCLACQIGQYGGPLSSATAQTRLVFFSEGIVPGPSLQTLASTYPNADPIRGPPALSRS